MKLKFSSLELLALSQIVIASPCKPLSSSVTTGLITTDAVTEHSTTTEPVPIFETALPSSIVADAETATTGSIAISETDTAFESATSLEATTASDTETLSTLSTETIDSSGTATTSEGAASSQPTTASEAEVETATTEVVATFESTTTPEGTTTSEATITASTAIEPETTEIESITTSEPTTTSHMFIISTTSAEPTTTTSILPLGPTNLLLNPDFEDSTVSPWVKNNIYDQEFISISTSEFHTGAQSGYMTARSGFTFNMGFKQDISASLIEAGKVYEFSAYAKTTHRVGCNQRRISCLSGGGGIRGGTWGGPDNVWNLITYTCIWTQAQLDVGPGISVFQNCQEMDLYLDDVVLVEVV